MISFDEANKIISAELNNLKTKTTESKLLESLNCILAEDIISDINLPPFNSSAMDGFAIKYSKEITKWEMIGEISAGNYKSFKLSNTNTVRIMTGGKLPDDCTAVIPVEDVIDNGSLIELKNSVLIKPGQNIRKLGEDLKQDQVAVQKNTLLSSKHISALATCGKNKVKVYDKLKIAVLVTGDELVDIDKIPTGDKIRGSNLYSLLALIKEMNMTPVNLGFVSDIKSEQERKIKTALESDINILLTTGGVSVGKFDYIPEIFKKLGVQIKFHKVNVKPGKPLIFGTFKNKDKVVFVFGLPGNPVSSFVDFILFVKAHIYKLFKIDEQNSIKADLSESIKKVDNKKHFMRGIYGYNSDSSKYFVEKLVSQSSGNMVGAGRANCLIVVDETTRSVAKGEEVECIMI
ncbi:MAG: gephyrin-like molybdotransferase Glp [Ignavibacteriaceae bacterium]